MKTRNTYRATFSGVSFETKSVRPYSSALVAEFTLAGLEKAAASLRSEIAAALEKGDESKARIRGFDLSAVEEYIVAGGRVEVVAWTSARNGETSPVALEAVRLGASLSWTSVEVVA